MDERIEAQPGPQTRFLASPADVAIYGGAAGGGKTWGLLLEPLRHVDNAGFGAVVFRRTYPRITVEGGMWDKSREIYPLLGARPNQTELLWRFPSGARVKFAHLQHADTVQEYHGSQIALLCFDELTEFSEGQFWYMFSRNRSTCGVRPYVRATCNPDADSWVAGLVAWWIDQETGLALPERSGVVRWFVRVGETLRWGDTATELRQRYAAVTPPVQPKSLTFIPATVHDNPALLRADPGYLANLMILPPVEQARLLGGNWKIKHEAGKVFNRAWFAVVEASATAGAVECRGWDFAATARQQRGNDPDFTSGVKIRRQGAGVSGQGTLYVVRDCVADQVGPADGDALFVNTSVQDALECRRLGISYRIRWEQDPGQAGIKESRRLVGLLSAAFSVHKMRLDAQGVPVHGDKLTRAASLASASKVGDVRLEAGGWNELWLRHMHAIPDGPHDDIMDASATAFNALAQERPQGGVRSHSLVTG